MTSEHQQYESTSTCTAFEECAPTPSTSVLLPIAGTCNTGSLHQADYGPYAKESNTLQWRDFEHDGKTYALAHLHPRTLQFERPAEDKKPAVVFNVDVVFSLHCFSREIPAEAYDPKLIYSDARESRLFDLERYELSKRLPEIIETLTQRKCFHTDRSDFVTVEVIREDASVVNYHVFFTVSKATKNGHLNLFVSSAYVANRKVGSSGMAIKFLFILHKTMNKIPFNT